MLRYIAAFASVVALMSFTLGAAADPWSSSDRRVGHGVVQYSDLNLSDPHDAQIMLGRLRQAAIHACGSSPKFDSNYSLTPFLVIRQFDKCVNEAIGGAVARLNAQALSMAFAEDNSRPNARIAQH